MNPEHIDEIIEHIKLTELAREQLSPVEFFHECVHFCGKRMNEEREKEKNKVIVKGVVSCDV